MRCAPSAMTKEMVGEDIFLQAEAWNGVRPQIDKFHCTTSDHRIGICVVFVLICCVPSEASDSTKGGVAKKIVVGVIVHR